MAQRFYMPRATALDANGFPISGAKLNFYVTGTSTPLGTFSDQALTSANTNPVVADGNGRFGEIWLQALEYKVVLTDAADVVIWTADPVSALGADGSDLTVIPTGGTTARSLADITADELDVKAFGAAADAAIGADGVSTDASAAFTSAAATFAAADIGKAIVVEGAGASGITITGATFSRAAVRFWQVDDTPTDNAYVDLTTEYNGTGFNNVILFPATEAIGDYCAIGYRQPFDRINFEYTNGTVGVGGVVVWEYWNGTVWTALAGVTDNTNSFTAAAGRYTVSWTVPTDWQMRALGGTAALETDMLLYVRAKITTVYSTNPVMDQGQSGLVRITATAHGLQHYQRVTIKDVGGTTEANGSRNIINVETNTFDLLGSVFTNLYTSGGTVHGKHATTIAGVTNATTITLAANSGASGTALDYIYGTDDRTAILAGDAAANTAGKSLVFSGKSLLIADTSFSSDIKFKAGGQVVMPSGITLTSPGALDAAPVQIFDGFGAVNLDGAGIDRIPSKWWGGGSRGAQGATDAAVFMGGGVVSMPDDFTADRTIVWKSGVTYEGSTINGTTVTAANSLNADVFQTDHFEALTGQNKWFITDNVQDGLGMRGISIDGNKANNVAGRGAAVYGKRIIIKEVYIRDCAGDGWYSEAADAGGQFSWQDNPESEIGLLWSRNNDGHGVVYRGPHDGRLAAVYANDNAGWGVRIERVASTYSGICYRGKSHIYSNTLGNEYDSAVYHAETMVVENGFGPGLVIEAKVIISTLEMYSNCRTTGTFQLDMSATTAQRAYIGSLEISLPGQASTGGAVLGSSWVHLGHADIRGNTGTSTGTGLQINGTADYCTINGGRIHLFNGGTGTGLDLNNGSASIGTQISGLVIDDCDTIWENNSGSNYTHIGMILDAKSGQTLFSGSGPSSSQNEDWQIKGTDASGTRVMTRERGTPAGSINLNSATVQSLTFTHHMLTTPDEEDIQVSLRHAGGLSNFRYSGPWITNITSTQVTASVAVTTAEGAAATGKLLFDIRV